jgi:hypothetical protein
MVISSPVVTLLHCDCNEACSLPLHKVDARRACVVMQGSIVTDFADNLAKCRRLRATQRQRCRQLAHYMANCIKVMVHLLPAATKRGHRITCLLADLSHGQPSEL